MTTTSEGVQTSRENHSEALRTRAQIPPCVTEGSEHGKTISRQRTTDLGKHDNVVSQPQFLDLLPLRAWISRPKHGRSGRQRFRLPRRSALLVLRKRETLKPL